jgi:hypothetical protein
MSSRWPLALGSERAMSANTNTRKNRMVLQGELLGSESELEATKAWQRAMEGVSARDFTIHGCLFQMQHCMGEANLKKRRLLELFRKTQRLPDYSRAADAVRRGWQRWVELDLGVRADDSKLKKLQAIARYELQHAPPEAQPQIFNSQSEIWKASADDGFSQKIAYALSHPAGTKDSTRDFARVLLHNWLTGFWWLMPLKSVAADFARIQGTSNDTGARQKIYDNLRQITSRRTEGHPGAYYSAGWNGCFYSTSPPLIHCFETNGKPLFSAEGRRLFR